MGSRYFEDRFNSMNIMNISADLGVVCIICLAHTRHATANSLLNMLFKRFRIGVFGVEFQVLKFLSPKLYSYIHMGVKICTP